MTRRPADLELYEISVVAEPVNPHARILSVTEVPNCGAILAVNDYALVCELAEGHAQAHEARNATGELVRWAK